MWASGQWKARPPASRTNGLDQLRIGCPLAEIAPRAGLQRHRDLARILVQGQNNDTGLGHQPPQHSGHFNAVAGRAE